MPCSSCGKSKSATKVMKTTTTVPKRATYSGRTVYAPKVKMSFGARGR